LYLMNYCGNLRKNTSWLLVCVVDYLVLLLVGSLESWEMLV
jgi:hypothetical protein